MRIVFFDTETNGLPLVKNAPVTDTKNWPQVVQIAWQVWEFSPPGDEETPRPSMLETHSYLVKPSQEMAWNAGSFAIHKISKERAYMEGTPGQEVFTAFSLALCSAHVVCAHNLAFDKPVTLAEFVRHGIDTARWPRIEYCTCVNTKELLKLPSRFPKAWDMYKPPKLVELYTFLYSPMSTFEFHSAAGDVQCLVQCFLELVRRRFVPLATWDRNLRVILGTAVDAK
jgi:DNA polymerase III epsilon subunit-like protein